MLFWALIIVAGGAAAGAVADRLTVDFSLPGQPGTDAADKIKATFGNGGDTSPYVVTVTLPAGQTVSGNQDAVAKTFDAVATAHVPVGNLRVVDEANTGNKYNVILATYYAGVQLVTTRQLRALDDFSFLRTSTPAFLAHCCGRIAFRSTRARPRGGGPIRSTPGAPTPTV